MNNQTHNNTVLFIYGGFESYGIEILSEYLKKRGFLTELFYFSKLFSDSIIELPYIADIFYKKELKRLLEFIRIKRPLLICFSVVSNDYLWSIDILKKIKMFFPQIKVIFGGIHPTLVPQKVINDINVDFVCEGAGEECLAILCNRLKNIEKNYEDIPNLWYKKDEVIFEPQKRSDFFIKDVNSTPDKELFFKKASYFDSDLSFQFTRGCLYSCSFCFHSYKNKKFGRGFFYLSPEDAIAELKSLTEKRKFKNIIFDDDIFIFNKKWIINFLKQYKKIINIPFMCVIHVNFIDEDIIKLLKLSACTKIELAVQTINSKVRHNILGRNESNTNIKKAVEILDRSGLAFNIQHMMGIPGTDIADEEKAVRFYSKYKIGRIYTFFLTYYPSIDITEYSHNEGIISDERYEQIREGKVSSYELDGDIRKDLIFDYHSIRILFSLVPIMPSFFIKVFSRNKRYRIFSKISFIFRLIDTFNIIKNNDRTARIYIKRYFYHIFKEFKYFFQ